MGSSESKEIHLFIGVILQLLNKRGIKVKKASVQSFSHLYRNNVLGFQEKALLT